MKNTDNKFNEKQRKTASSTYPPRSLSREILLKEVVCVWRLGINEKYED
ncbi:hypothetical protein [[Clostridium] symbiosum]|nr:hypothetical protein [[Clostridium] symbiosum]